MGTFQRNSGTTDGSAPDDAAFDSAAQEGSAPAADESLDDSAYAMEAADGGTPDLTWYPAKNTAPSSTDAALSTSKPTAIATDAFVTDNLSAQIPAGGISEDDLESQLAFKNLQERRKKKRKKRIIKGVVFGILAVLIISGIVIWNTVQSVLSSYTPMQTTTISRADFADTVTSTGSTEPISSTIVTPEVDGIIDTVNVTVGQAVVPGDVILTLKNASLDKTVSEAQQQVKVAQNGVDSANAAVDQAYAAYNEAVNAYNQTIAAGGTATFDKATLSGAITTAELQLDSARITLESAQKTYDEAVSNAGKRTVTASTAGTVIAVNAVSGAAVGSATGATAATAATSSSPLVEIADLSQMKVTIQVNEVDISKVAVGQNAVVTFSALPDLSLPATVTNIATVASSSASATGTSSSVVTYAVDVLIPQPDVQLKPGMTASVVITTESIPNTLMVLSTAIQTDDAGKTYVSLVTDAETGATERRDVTVKAHNSTQSVIEGNVSDGDTVAFPDTSAAESISTLIAG